MQFKIFFSNFKEQMYSQWFALIELYYGITMFLWTNL